jgi:hypothetical protein
MCSNVSLPVGSCERVLRADTKQILTHRREHSTAHYESIHARGVDVDSPVCVVDKCTYRFYSNCIEFLGQVEMRKHVFTKLRV